MGDAMVGEVSGARGTNAQPFVQLQPPPDCKYASTRLRGGQQVISQEQLLAVMSKPGAAEKSVADLFSFWRPTPQNSRKSALLHMTDQQLDAMYALAGCMDVAFLIGRVKRQVRKMVQRLYKIDKLTFAIWYKNRGRNTTRLTMPHAMMDVARGSIRGRAQAPAAGSPLTGTALGRSGSAGAGTSSGGGSASAGSGDAVTGVAGGRALARGGALLDPDSHVLMLDRVPPVRRISAFSAGTAVPGQQARMPEAATAPSACTSSLNSVKQHASMGVLDLTLHADSSHGHGKLQLSFSCEAQSLLPKQPQHQQQLQLQLQQPGQQLLFHTLSTAIAPQQQGMDAQHAQQLQLQQQQQQQQRQQVEHQLSYAWGQPSAASTAPSLSTGMVPQLPPGYRLVSVPRSTAALASQQGLVMMMQPPQAAQQAGQAMGAGTHLQLQTQQGQQEGQQVAQTVRSVDRGAYLQLQPHPQGGLLQPSLGRQVLQLQAPEQRQAVHAMPSPQQQQQLRQVKQEQQEQHQLEQQAAMKQSLRPEILGHTGQQGDGGPQLVQFMEFGQPQVVQMSQQQLACLYQQQQGQQQLQQQQQQQQLAGLQRQQQEQQQLAGLQRQQREQQQQQQMVDLYKQQEQEQQQQQQQQQQQLAGLYKQQLQQQEEQQQLARFQQQGGLLLQRQDGGHQFLLSAAPAGYAQHMTTLGGAAVPQGFALSSGPPIAAANAVDGGQAVFTDGSGQKFVLMPQGHISQLGAGAMQVVQQMSQQQYDAIKQQHGSYAGVVHMQLA